MKLVRLRRMTQSTKLVAATLRWRRCQAKGGIPRITVMPPRIERMTASGYSGYETGSIVMAVEGKLSTTRGACTEV